MKRVTAIVRGGRLVVDEPTNLPEGTKVELEVPEQAEDLSEAERAALHRAIAASREQHRRGDRVPADEVLADLRKRS